MLFDTKTERERFFQQGHASLGSAMRHARTTQLGIWSDLNLLRHDCARVLAMEIASNFGERVTPEQIEADSLFRRAFQRARGDDEADLGLVLGIIGISSGNRALLQEGGRIARGGIEPQYLAGIPSDRALAREVFNRLCPQHEKPNKHRVEVEFDPFAQDYFER